VLNSLIFPAHEQHHNNSFLCAALLMGQTNMAAGATVGSNHNSRGADGELIAGRGFWPGLCVSIKHNSRFASFIIMAKGDYPAELDIPIPFSLVSNDVAKDELIVMPAYWFMHNMYALARNAWKYIDRDKRLEKIQLLEYDYLAPDSIQELAIAIEKLEMIAARSWMKHERSKSDPAGVHSEVPDDSALQSMGKTLLEKNNPGFSSIPFFADRFENSSRKVRVIKLAKGYSIFRELIIHYAVKQIIDHVNSKNYSGLREFQQWLPENKTPEKWINAGGQLIRKSSLDKIVKSIKEDSVCNWNDIHQFYKMEANQYPADKLYHALDILNQVQGISVKSIKSSDFSALLLQSVATAEWITNGIFRSREKDYLNPFRQMVYDNQSEMDKVIGKLDENSFIKNQEKAFSEYKHLVRSLIASWKLV
jgi:hypothetical protein